MDMAFAAEVFTNMLALMLSLSFHESAHAFAAKLQGDDTAEQEGRLTLNPIPHIDLLGTIIFPLIGAISGAAVIGWAKPVPVEPRNFKNPKWGNVLVAAVGPLSNLLLSILCILLVATYQLHMQEIIPPGHFLYPLVKLAAAMVWLNAILAIFNMLPLTPLDGGTVLVAFLPPRLKDSYDAYVAPYGMYLLLALFFTGGLRWMGQLAGGLVHISQALVGMMLLS